MTDSDPTPASDHTIPLPAAPTAEEWEPFLRARRSTDNNPIVLTERQVARMLWITGTVLDADSPDHAAALDQLADVSTYLGALLIDSPAPRAEDLWKRLEDKPHFLRGSHQRRIADLRREGLDPYGRQLPESQ